MEIAQGIHRIEAPLGERFNALYLLVGSEASLLIDTGLAAGHRGHAAAVSGIHRITLPSASATRVNTHSDFDHMGGNAALRASRPLGGPDVPASSTAR